jgi:hypothetical protein
MFLFLISISFALSSSMLLFYHIFLTYKNRSTLGSKFLSIFKILFFFIFISFLESYKATIFHTFGPDKNGFNLGWRENIKQVFGNRMFLMFFPVFTR